jgi:hypothetical protein
MTRERSTGCRDEVIVPQKVLSLREYGELIGPRSDAGVDLDLDGQLEGGEQVMLRNRIDVDIGDGNHVIARSDWRRIDLEIIWHERLIGSRKGAFDMRGGSD